MYLKKVCEALRIKGDNMRTGILILLVSLLMSGYGLAGQYQKVRVYIHSAAELENLIQLGIDLEGSLYKKDRFIDLVLNEAQMHGIQDKGYQTEVLIDDLEQYYASRLETRSGEGFGYGSMGGFYTYSEVMASLDSMQVLYPNLVSQKDTIGYSILGKPIVAVKISDNPEVQESEPEIIYTGLHHAREPAGMMAVLYYMWYLLENYGSEPQATYLVDNRQMWFVPVVNPDGYVYNQQTNPGGGGMWRMNARDNNNNAIYFQSGFDGVDLNRNYGYQWGYDNIGSSPYPGDDTYRGPSPFSEIETQTIRNFCNQHQFLTAFNYHTYSNLLIHPWAYNDSPTPDHFLFQTFGFELTRLNGYILGTPSQTVGYAVNGDTDDWMYGEQTTKPKILAYGPEVGTSSDGFWPTTDRILPLVQENLYPNLLLSYIAGAYPRLYDKSIFVYGQNQFIEPGEVVEVLPAITNFGLQNSTGLDLQLLPFNNQVEMLTAGATVPALNSFDSLQASNPWSFRVKYSTAPGSELQFKVQIYENGLLINQENLSLGVGNYETVFSSNFENGLSQWINGGSGGSWGLTTASSHSPTHSLTDSPSGEYGNSANFWIRTPAISLANASSAILSYWTKWAIETDWDFGLVEISTNNGSSWSPLIAPHMTAGSGLGMQPTGLYGYDGFQQNWIEESIDLSAFAGQNIQLRFRLTSDSWVTEDGWYLDDLNLQILNPNINIPPYVKSVSQLTQQFYTGTPYTVSAVILDDEGAQQVSLFYSTDGGSSFQEILMSGSDSLFAASIPALNPGITVHYYVQAWDSAGSYSLYPYNAPQQNLSFSIFSSGPVLVVDPSELHFIVPQLLSGLQPLMLSNPGTDPVNYQITDTSSQILEKGSLKQLDYLNFNHISKILKNKISLRSIAPISYPENQEQEISGGLQLVEVITDSAGDVSIAGNDIVSVNFSETLFSFNLTITFAAAPDTSAIGIVSFDIDQNFATGAYPAPFGLGLGNYDLGSEYEIYFDFPNSLGDTLGLPPSAYVFDVSDTTMTPMGLPLPIQFSGNNATISLFKILFNIFDPQMNITASMLNLSGLSLPDLAPDFGHGNLGGELGSSWISQLESNGTAGYPMSGIINPGDSTLVWIKVAAAYPLGTYNGAILINNNSPVSTVPVPVQMTIELPGAPQIAVDPGNISDTLQYQGGTQNYAVTISNSGSGSLYYSIADTLFNGSGWLQVSPSLGMIPAGETNQIEVQVDPAGLSQNTLYQAELHIISNDLVSPEVVVPIDIFIFYPNQIITGPQLPTILALYTNYPNPFNPTTTIAIDIPMVSQVKLEIFNILGQRVKVLVDGELMPGQYTYLWDARNDSGEALAAGIYFYKLQAGRQTIVKKMILTK